MRVAAQTLLLALAVLPVLGSLSATAAELAEADVAERIDEYMKTATSEARREALVEELRSTDPVLAQRTLGKYLQSQEHLPRALSLATELGVPGLYPKVRDLVDSIHEDRVVRLLLTTQDRGAVRFLAKRWATVETGSASYLYLTSAFSSMPLADAPDILGFKPHLSSKDEVRRSDAGKIVAFQLNMTESTPDAVRANWTDAFGTFSKDSTTFAKKGRSLLRNPARMSTNFRRVGSNYRVGPGGRLILGPLPEELQSGGWTVRVRMKVKRGNGGSAGIQMNHRQVWDARLQDGDWVSKEQYGSEDHLPGKLDRWVEIQFSWHDESKGSRRLDRLLTLTVDGKVLIERGVLNGELTALFFEGGDGEVVVSNVEYRR